MKLFAKIVDCIQPLAIFAKHLILGVSQVYEYGVMSLILQKIGLESLQIPEKYLKTDYLKISNNSRRSNSMLF